MRGRGFLWTLVLGSLLAVGVLWGTIVALGYGPQLGLDLRGGISITLAPDQGQDYTQTDLGDAVDVLRARVDALGVAEPELARRGDNIMVQLPGLENQNQAEDVIERTASLQFRRVRDIVYPPGDPRAGRFQRPSSDASSYQQVGPPCEQLDQRFVDQGPPPDDQEIVVCETADRQAGGANGEAGGESAQSDDEAQPRAKYVLGPTEIPGDAIEDAQARLSQQGAWQTQLQLDDQGADTFAEVTADLACASVGSIERRFAVVLDGQARSYPVSSDVPCDVGITGGAAVIDTGSQAQAEEIATVLRGGSLPIQLSITQSEAVSPTLGQESLEGGLQAGFLGLALVAGYLVMLYRGIGAVAIAELAMFGVVVYGLIIVLGNTIGFTLTLAGIAGVVVSVGIAADSSIIYRERYRDEIRAGATVRSAADKAFTRAFRTNLTGNTVSFLAAGVLYLLAIGPVRGFAFTLGLSTLIDTLLLATFTRGLFGLVSRNKRLARSRWMGLRAHTVAPRLTRAGDGVTTAAGDQAPAPRDGQGERAHSEDADSHDTEVGREP
jgi:protein-export membrane protein SecD